MNNPVKGKDNPLKALIVVVAVSLACSILVSFASITLKPIQLLNQKVERSRHIVALTGLVPSDKKLTNDEILNAVEQLDIRVIDIGTGDFDNSIDPEQFDARTAVNNPELSVTIPPDDDLARLGRRARHAIVYLVWEGNELSRIILPVHGQGMWSTLHGLLALEVDFNTIGAVTFYEQAETAGLGDQITRPDWQLKWQGRQLFNSQGDVVFRVAAGSVAEDSAAALHQVDAISGATVTAVSVTRLVEFWFGPNGYLPFLNKLKNQPPTRQVSS
ncbi:MAG: Na(+)-translocating NADH-quinone reductase subunit C [Pseudomonadales bacterium]